MSFDTSPLGRLAAEAMEQIEEQFGEDATLSLAAFVVEVESGDDSHIFTAATDSRSWVQIAFLRKGIRTVKDAQRDRDT